MEQARTRLICIGVLVALFGFATAQHQPALKACAAGAGALLAARLLQVYWVRSRHEREVRVATAKRAERRSIRRERTAAARQQRHIEHRSRVSQARQVQVEKRVRAARTEADRARRSIRDGMLQLEAERLKTLGEQALLQEVASILETRGGVSSVQECDITLTGCVARCVPAERKARAADVRLLEAWRVASSANSTMLVAVGGFSHEAVRAAERLPVTLVDAHLLASWKFASPDERDD